MKIQYQIFEIRKMEVLTQYESGYMKSSTMNESITALEPISEPNSFNTMPLAQQHLSTLKKGKYTILTVYEI